MHISHIRKVYDWLRYLLCYDWMRRYIHYRMQYYWTYGYLHLYINTVVLTIILSCAIHWIIMASNMENTTTEVEMTGNQIFQISTRTTLEVKAK